MVESASMVKFKAPSPMSGIGIAGRTVSSPEASAGVGLVTAPPSSNVTVVTEALEDVEAFDTGPANALIDAFARQATGREDGTELFAVCVDVESGKEKWRHMVYWRNYRLE